MVRLPQHGSDVLLTLNTPIFISASSAAAEHAGAQHAPAGPPLQPPALLRHAAACTARAAPRLHPTNRQPTCWPPAAAGAGFKEAHLAAPQLFRQFLASFRINDWALFGGGGGGADQ